MGLTSSKPANDGRAHAALDGGELKCVVRPSTSPFARVLCRRGAEQTTSTLTQLPSTLPLLCSQEADRRTSSTSTSRTPSGAGPTTASGAGTATARATGSSARTSCASLLLLGAWPRELRMLTPGASPFPLLVRLEVRVVQLQAKMDDVESRAGTRRASRRGSAAVEVGPESVSLTDLDPSPTIALATDRLVRPVPLQHQESVADARHETRSALPSSSAEPASHAPSASTAQPSNLSAAAGLPPHPGRAALSPTYRPVPTALPPLPSSTQPSQLVRP